MFCKRSTFLSLISHLSYYIDRTVNNHKLFLFGIYWSSLTQQTYSHSRLTDFQMPKKLEHLENKYWLWLGLDIQPYSWGMWLTWNPFLHSPQTNMHLLQFTKNKKLSLITPEKLWKTWSIFTHRCPTITLTKKTFKKEFLHLEKVTA